MPSRICIDARMLGDGGTGVATYARTLVAAVALLGRPHGLLRGEPNLGPASRFLRAAAPGRKILRQNEADLVGADIFRVAQSHFNLHGRALRLRAPGLPGIMHWSYPVPMVVEGWRNLYTIHDLIPLTHPRLTPIDPGRHRRLIKAIDRVADSFVTVSEAAKQDIVGMLGCAPERVVNCGQAVIEEEGGTLPEALEPDRYFLYCGRIETRKNLTKLIEAHLSSRVDMKLVLVGPIAEGGSDILAAGGRINPNMLYLPYVDRKTLLAIIAHARALLLHSLAEGFGLPVAEAMCLGTPTLISQDPALLETAGGAALVVNGEDDDAMASALARLGSDPTLCADLTARGFRQAERFSLFNFAQRLDALYTRFAPGSWA